MASTAKGNILTDQHRRRQVALAITADSQMRRVWDDTLDVNDLDHTQPIWKKAMLDLLGQWWKVSADTAAQYLPRFRKAEIGDGSVKVGVPRFNRSQAGKRLEWGGVANILWHVAMGQTQEAAYLAARELFIGMFHEAVLTGGRLTLQQWAAKDARASGWRRVSDGHPCAFCAMLVGRGPIYTSERTALYRQSDGDKFHPHCGCTVEVVYGRREPAQRHREDIRPDTADHAQDRRLPRLAIRPRLRSNEKGPSLQEPRGSNGKALNTTTISDFRREEPDTIPTRRTGRNKERSPQWQTTTSRTATSRTNQTASNSPIRTRMARTDRRTAGAEGPMGTRGPAVRPRHRMEAHPEPP